MKLNLPAKAVGGLSPSAGEHCALRRRRLQWSRYCSIASATSLKESVRKTFSLRNLCALCVSAVSFLAKTPETTSASDDSNLVTIRTHCDTRDGFQTGPGKVGDFLPGPIRFLSHEQLCIFRHQEITRRSPGIILNAGKRLDDRSYLPRLQIVRFDHPFLTGNLVYE